MTLLSVVFVWGCRVALLCGVVCSGGVFCDMLPFVVVVQCFCVLLLGVVDVCCCVVLVLRCRCVLIRRAYAVCC